MGRQSSVDHDGGHSAESAGLLNPHGRAAATGRIHPTRDTAGISMAAVIGSTLFGIHTPQRTPPQR